MKNSSIKSGLAIHGATVALTPARALTSHLRHRYRTRYHGRYRYARLVFGFDLALALIALGLVALNVYLFVLRPVKTSGLGLIFYAPPIASAAPIAFQADVIARDGKDHRDLRLHWQLPPGTEVISASPPLDANGESYLGSVAAGQTVSARVIVRLFVPEGSVRLGFRVQDGGGAWGGSETRPVVRSGLRLEPLVRPDAAVAGTPIPYRVRNDTASPIESVEFSADGRALVDGKSPFILGTLAPYAERLVLVDPREERRVRVTASAHAVPLRVEMTELADARSGATVELEPATPGQDTFVTVRTKEPVTLVVAHSALLEAKDGVRSFDLTAGEQRIRLPLDPAYTKTVDRWFAFLIVVRNGKTLLGPLAEGVATTPFNVSASVRYYAATGDQLGVGPLPPRVGEETKYWVSWKIGPTTADLSSLIVRATLPPGVRLTGREALPSGGTIAKMGEEVVWTLDYVPASAEPITASFEIGFTPIVSQRGKSASLISSTTASAKENRSGTQLSASSPSVDTSLPGDEKAANRGIVD